MTTFTIDNDNNITAFASNEEATAAGGEVQLFTSAKELNRIASDWPAERMVAIWNGLPGVEAVTKFKSAKAGVARIWERIQSLAEPTKRKAEPTAKGGARRPRLRPRSRRRPRRPAPRRRLPSRPRARSRPRLMGRAKAARPRRWSRCSSGRTARRWRRSWRRWVGRSTRSAGSWPAR